MPKPVLSDSLFNADDVATAVLSEANLQVTNNQLGVTDKSSIFSKSSGFNDNGHSIIAHSFNGFMFVSFNVVTAGALDTNYNEHTIYTITDSNFYPETMTSAPTAGFEGDIAYTIKFNTSGTIVLSYPTNAGGSGFHAVVNCFYRF